MNFYVISASYLGTAVEFLEALTLVLAVGATKGCRSALSGMVTILLLKALVVLFGGPLMNFVHISAFQLIIDILMRMFGSSALENEAYKCMSKQ